jgi:Flp pilus assembly protein TadD
MYRGNEYRWLPGLLTAAALVAESIAASAQAPNLSASALSLPTPVVSEPQFQPTPVEEGDLLMAHQRYQAAIEMYKKAPRDSPDAWNKMGVAYQLMFNTEEAMRCYQKALKLNPKSASAMNNLGAVYVTLKNYSAAERSYRKAMKLDPKTAIFHKNLGTALLADHKYKKGWDAYKAALDLDPAIFDHSSSFRIQNPSSVQDRGAMNYYMAKGCVRAGMNDRAVEYLRMALNEGFTNPKKIIADTEFAALHDFPAFQKLLASQGVP